MNSKETKASILSNLTTQILHVNDFGSGSGYSTSQVQSRRQQPEFSIKLKF
jgi:hypothetical protein